MTRQVITQGVYEALKEALCNHEVVLTPPVIVLGWDGLWKRVNVDRKATRYYLKAYERGNSEETDL